MVWKTLKKMIIVVVVVHFTVVMGWFYHKYM